MMSRFDMFGDTILEYSDILSDVLNMASSSKNKPSKYDKDTVFVDAEFEVKEDPQISDSVR